jgi:hypothetical protein
MAGWYQLDQELGIGGRDLARGGEDALQLKKIALISNINLT